MSDTGRFQALDVFRGMTICFMIIVNTGGNEETFSPLLHAQWHGFTPTDLVFPSFLFAVGNSLAFVLPKWETLPASEVSFRIIKRTLIIFLIGMIMFWFPFVRYNEQHELIYKSFAQVRILGVLQRIALTYMVSSFLLYFLKTRGAVVVSVIFLLLYWILMYSFGDPGDPFSLTGNAALKLDLWAMGPNHLYHGEGLAFDPEGILGILPSVGNVIVGFLAGKLIMKKGKTYETLSKLLLAGFFLIFISYCWNFFFPVNKKIWTSSFVTLTTGIDCVVLAGIIYVIDFLKFTRWTRFFEVFGKNPLFIYIVSEVLVILLWFIIVPSGKPLYSTIYTEVFSYAGPYWGSLLFAMTFMLICWLTGWFMDKKKIYVRV